MDLSSARLMSWIYTGKSIRCRAHIAHNKLAKACISFVELFFFFRCCFCCVQVLVSVSTKASIIVMIICSPMGQQFERMCACMRRRTVLLIHKLVFSGDFFLLKLCNWKLRSQMSKSIWNLKAQNLNSINQQRQRIRTRERGRMGRNGREREKRKQTKSCSSLLQRTTHVTHTYPGHIHQHRRVFMKPHLQIPMCVPYSFSLPHSLVAHSRFVRVK